MKHIVDRRELLRVGLALGSSLLLPSARACEFFSSTLRVTHPWTRASVEGATSAIVCMTIDQVTTVDRLIGVETPVAEGAEIVNLFGKSSGVNLQVFKGQELVLGEAGVRLRLVGLTQALLMARTYPMRLYFEKGGTLETELNIDYMPTA